MTDRKQALIDLLKNVEEGRGFDHDHPKRKARVAQYDCLGGYYQDSMAYGAFHDSLDAAKALHEAVLPGSWHYDIDSEAGGVCVFQLGVNNAQIGEHNNLARAWLIAILKALIEMEKDNG